MSNHGITTLGTSLSQAYHRLTSMVAETARLITATLLAKTCHKKLNVLSEEEMAHLYEIGAGLVYGESKQSNDTIRLK
jgi:ribulose-5-phosphate 4-epimerase/fuculose-1-phosphate aldolase